MPYKRFPTGYARVANPAFSIEVAQHVGEWRTVDGRSIGRVYGSMGVAAPEAGAGPGYVEAGDVCDCLDLLKTPAQSVKLEFSRHSK